MPEDTTIATLARARDLADRDRSPAGYVADRLLERSAERWTAMRASATTVSGATRGSRLNWTWVVLSAVAIAGFFVSQYLTGSLAELAQDQVGLSTTYAKQPPPVQIAFYAHVVFSGAALMLGPWQFVRWIRRHHIRLHRFVGRTYLGCVAVGAAGGLILAPFNTAGMVGFFGFGALAVLWAWTGWRAYRAVRARDIGNHQAWMIRNFALTYAAVTLRLWLVALIFIQLPFRSGFAGFSDAYAAAYPAVPFLCWLPNIVVAEWLVRRRGLPTMRITPPRQDPTASPQQRRTAPPAGP